MQLTIQDAANEMDGMLTMLTKCKRILSHYHHSYVVMKRLKEEQKKDLVVKNVSIATK